MLFQNGERLKPSNIHSQMKKLIVTILSISILLITGCSTQTILVDSETELSESYKVEWLITKTDSIMDFRKSNQGFASVKNNEIYFNLIDDSVKTLKLDELKTIYVKEDASIASYIIGGVIIAYILFSVWMGASSGT
jgi:competence protein ComGF